jgi:hypothetical protein
MDSFKQSNPIANFKELRENIKLTKERLTEAEDRVYAQIPLMMENPVIRQLTIANLKMVLKYFKLQIKFHELLKENKPTGFLAYYIDFIIKLNKKYETKIEKVLDILENEKRQEYGELVVLIKMYTIAFYISVLGESVPKLDFGEMCKNVSKDISNFTLDPEIIKQKLQGMTETIQSKVNVLESEISNMTEKAKETIQEMPIPGVYKQSSEERSQPQLPKRITPGSTFLEVSSKPASEEEEPIRPPPSYEEAISQQKQLISNKLRQNINTNIYDQYFNQTKQGGEPGSGFRIIYDPVNLEWVNINSRKGKQIFNKYVDNLFQN